MRHCKKCGRCCEVIHVPFSYDDLKNGEIVPTKPYDGKFILEHWKQLNNYVDIWRLSPGKSISDYMCYYKCDMYDIVSHSCKCQWDKPPVCADYPYYDCGPHYISEFPECGFNEGIL